MKTVKIIALVLALIALVGCTASSYDPIRASEGQEEASFFRGLWHGMIAPIAFIISIFNSEVSIYEAVNNGFLYNLGFIIGLSMSFGGSGGAAGRARKRKKREQNLD